MKAKLALEDGRIFVGRSVGAAGERTGEVVFNTSLTGYQEILTDPSYKGQMVTMTYPHIGNYGVNDTDVESGKPRVEGFIMRECCRRPSNWRAVRPLADYLAEHDIVAIEGVDTRALTKHIRTEGAMRAVLSTLDLDDASLVAKAKASPGLVGRDLVDEVTCMESYRWDTLPATLDDPEAARPALSEEKYRVVCIDYGVKYNILRNLVLHGCDVEVVPASMGADEILSRSPDGVMLSNGPGDPAAVPYAVETLRQLIGRVPIFGICLGHQLLGLALGGKTYKLKFGHRGGNQPVMDLTTRKVEITSQNHGFCVDMESLDARAVEVTHINLNDKTVEGMRHRSEPVFSVQYHPEAAPGPHDAHYLFARFIAMMRNLPGEA